MGIKSFIYLDEYKMYSISSQLFEGLTEHIIESDSKREEKSENQKGPFTSGRVVADISTTVAASEKKKFLHDYSYVLFEKQLLKDDLVTLVTVENINEALQEIDQRSFIKITGRALFNDLAIINNLLEKFNEVGQALAYVTNASSLIELKEKHEAAINQAKDGKKTNNKQQAATLIKETIEKARVEFAETLAGYINVAGLSQDEDFLKNIRYILDFGLRDQLEFQIRVATNEGQHFFSANLTRQYLKEAEEMLVRKYARFTEKNFTILGIVTQHSTLPLMQLDSKPTGYKDNLKDALLGMGIIMYGIEENFIGRQPNEIIIDPIAIYREL